jgi:membrane peptidoglycan carboxypeptidase
VLGGLLGLVGLSAAAGILVTAAVTPALAISGMGASNTIKVFNSLPDFLEITPLMEKSTVYVYDTDGKTPLQLAQFYDQNRQEVQWDQISQFFKDAAVAKEDNRYYEHGGVDIIGTSRAVVSNALGQNVQGGSSITQQYVKNTLVQRCVSDAESVEEGEKCATAYTTADGSDGMARKLKEMRYAIGLEKKYSKDEILRGYLNIAHFGGVTYGVESASQYYFGVSAKDANLVQAATIVSMVTNPNTLRIDRPDSETNGAANGYAETLAARNVTLAAMHTYGKITDEQYNEAKEAPVEPQIRQPQAGCEPSGGAAFFCDYVINEIKNSPAFGENPADRLNLLKRGGLDIYTTLDMTVQHAAEESIYGKMPTSIEGMNVAAAAVTVQPGTGRILAMSQSKKFSTSQTGGDYTQVNYNTDKDYGGSSGFQAGSSWKLFTLVNWLENGNSVNASVNGLKRSFQMYDSCGMGGGTWDPKNAGEGGYKGGNMTVRAATERSVNTAYAAMASQLDLCEISKTAEALGAHRADGTPLQTNNSSILGTNEVSPLTMATAYAAIANRGVLCTPVAIDKIIDPEGTELAKPESTCSQAIDEGIAATAAYALQGVMSRGTGTASNPYEAPILGKTGTADEYRHTWIVDSTTKVTTAVWVGNVDGFTKLHRTSIKGYNGGQLRHAISRPIMDTAIAKYGGDAFPAPDPDLTKVVTRAVSDVSGMSVEEATAQLEASGFEVTVADGEVPSSVEAGRVARSDPAGGGRATLGSTITLFISSGQGAVVPDVMGDDPRNAKQELEGAGFAVAVDGSCTADGARVTSQNPGGNTDGQPGSTVSIGCG